MIENPDHKILELCQQPDTMNYGFNLLVHKYQQKVYMHIRRIIIDHDDTVPEMVSEKSITSHQIRESRLFTLR